MDAFMQENAASLQLSCWHDQEYLHIQIQPPDSGDLPPTDLVAILDTSASMETEAWVKNKEGIKESQGMTILNVLKHAVKTTIYNLSKNDRFGLVSYNDQGYIEYNLDYMIEAKQKIASDVLEQLQPMGSTNLWSGLYEGLEILRNKYQPNRQSAIILLTDGEPNIFPPSSFEEMLEKYKAKYPQFIFTLYTIALGKFLDSKLLSNLAEIGAGQYSFIPCPGFMGTIFVNSFTNILTTMCNNAELSVKLDNDNKILEIMGFKETKAKKSAKQAKIPIGEIKYGQTKDVILKLQKNPYQFANQLMGTVTLKTWNWGTQQELSLQCQCFSNNATNIQKISSKAQISRAILCDSIIDLQNSLTIHSEDLTKAQDVIKQCVKKIITLASEQKELIDNEEDLDGPQEQMEKHLAGILKDAQGEVSLSVLRPDFWQQWGRHFLPSIRNAHLKQSCNNFIDPGVQFYGGRLFREIRNQVEETFMKIPPPQKKKKQIEEEKKVSNQAQNYAKPQQPQQQRKRTPSPVRMEDYYDCGGGGCFAGQCQALTLNGKKRIDQIQKGDYIVNNSQGQSSKVIAVVKIESKVPLITVKIGQLLITPKHPIFINKQWIKPIEIANKNELQYCQTFYNFVLENNHTAMIENIMCTTLGHMIKGEKVEHPYFGTQLILQDLKKITGWKKGFIQIQNEQFSRDLKTGKINGIK